MKTRRILAVFLFLAGFAIRLSAQSYTVTDLGTLSGSTSYTSAISDAGQVVGDAETSGGDNHATLFSGNGSGNTDLGTLGGSTSYAYAINDSSQIVGVAQSSSGDYYGTLFSGTGSGNTNLGGSHVTGGQDSSAYAINNSGQIVGLVGEVATLFSGNGSGNTSLGGGIALAINDSSQIVGEAAGAHNPQQAVLFANNGSGDTYLSNNQAVDNIAFGNNNLGQVVGAEIGADYKTYQATLFGQDGGQHVDFLNGVGGSSYFSDSYAINDAGEIAGTMQIDSAGDTHGFLYVSGTMMDLNSLVSGSPGVSDITVNQGRVLNNWGQIAAVGTVAGNQVALMLNPVSPVTTASAGVQDVKLVAGMKYDQFAAFSNINGNNTEVSFLDGTAAVNRDVQVTFLAATAGLRSDIAQLSLTAPGGSTKQDTFVLQLSYTGSAPGAVLGFFDVGTDQWENAVLGDTSGGSGTFVDGAYNPSTDFVLGDYGIDTSDDTVWAVVAEHGEFAVIDAVPEPSTWTMLLCAAGILASVKRLRPA